MNYELLMNRIKRHNAIVILMMAVLLIGLLSQKAFAAGGDVVWEYGITPMAGKQEAMSMVVDSAGDSPEMAGRKVPWRQQLRKSPEVRSFSASVSGCRNTVSIRPASDSVT